jgi:hypothetical protein
VEAQWLLTDTLGADRVRAEPYATTSLAALCGYLPLALCAAAANFAEGRHECVADQVAELRGEISPGGPRSAGTGGPVRAALEPSYRGLPARARRLLRLLGLVPGADFTTAAAAALAGLDLAAAESSLDRLAAVHLIHEHAPGRFRLHLLVRQYAIECARRAEDDTERAGAVRRLLGWYLRHARAAVAWFDAADADPDELVFGEPDRAAGWLAAEWGNLAAAVRHGPDPLAGLLGDTLRGYLDATVGHTGRVDRLARWWGELPRQLSRGEPETVRTVLVPRR